MKQRRSARACCASVVLCMAGPGRAEDLEAFYASHPIKLIVGTGTGGGYDIYRRVIAPHFGRYVPGRPEVIVIDMPGASSLNAANYIANVASKDPTEVLLPVQTCPSRRCPETTRLDSISGVSTG